MQLRDGFRLAGMRAEVGYLAKERFTGELLYTRSGPELKREMKEIIAGENGDADIDQDVTKRVIQLAEVLDKWIVSPESPMRIFFKRGFIKRIEF